jgi:hypothetical protein
LAMKMHFMWLQTVSMSYDLLNSNLQIVEIYFVAHCRMYLKWL